MQRFRSTFAVAVLVFGWASITSLGARSPRPRYPNVRAGRTPEIPPLTRGVRGASYEGKLDLDLRILVAQFAPVRGEMPVMAFNSEELQSLFGIKPDADDPGVNIAIRLEPGAEPASLQQPGIALRSRDGHTVYARARLSAIVPLAGVDSVRSIALLKASALPQSPDPLRTTRGGARRGETERADTEFDRHGLSGKGVIVGVVDSGIDWKHPDFIRPDGTTRILYLYDLTDESWTKSHGSVGSKPPLSDEDGALGTLYTREQINQALKGAGQVTSRDRVGHGTACAGTAAGSGRATANGVPEGTYSGIAPEADLIVVKAGEGGGIQSDYIAATEWLIGEARKLNRPCAVNMSFGGHWSTHDGTEPEEARLDALAGPGKPGVVICVAAGNEGQKPLHAGGRFGPKRPGQLDIQGDQTELFVGSNGSKLLALLSHGDEWGLTLLGTGLTGDDDKPVACNIFHTGDQYQYSFEEGKTPSAELEHFFSRCFRVTQVGNSQDRLEMNLRPGHYVVWCYGATEKVENGRFDLYLPIPQAANFARGGVEHQFMVGSPGNARNVITVGSYIFRKSWENLDGKWSNVNLKLGGLSAYSSPGYRRDSQVKPDLSAPGQYAISSLAEGSAMALRENDEPDRDHVTHDGRHVAWSGTSAATPFVCGVAALMLEKNPGLDVEQVRQILRRTTKTDDDTGAVPNREWGYGKIQPAAALVATPASSAVTATARR